MRITLIVIFVILLAFDTVTAVQAEEQGWSLKPFEMKDSYTKGNQGVITAGWGFELNVPMGVFEATGEGNFSEDEHKFSLGYSKELGAWFFNLWGMIDQDENATLTNDGLKVQWENEHVFGGVTLNNLKRDPDNPQYRYGYEGWETKANWGLLTKNNLRFKMVLDRKKLDYFRTDDSSDKLDLEATLQYKILDSQWELLWREQTSDYPDDSLENLWGNYGELNWTHRFKQHKTKISLSGSQHEQGDGLIENQAKFAWKETFYFDKGTLSLNSYLNRRDGTSWIEDIYVLDEEQAEDWKINTESGWGIDLNWRREMGLHRQWKFGGYFHNNYTKDSWGVHTEWDCYVWSNWRLRLYLRASGSDDHENPAGAWIKMTYYF